MTYLFTPLFRRLSAALLFTTALGATAFAQSFPEISPETIARDVEQRYDARTGETEYIAQSFDPFENDPALAGSAALRSAGEAVTINGQIIRGGAFLDISTIYTTGSDDPYDVRGYENAVFPSGQPVGVVRYDNKTLDCSRDVREVTYDDGYYSGASYGYIAGIYRLFPRYRGHRHYGWRRGYGANRGYGHWRRGYSGYGHGDTRRRRGGHDDGVHRRRRGGDTDVTRRRPRSGDGDVRRRRGGGDGDVTRRRPRDGDVDRPRRRPGNGDGDVRRPRTGNGVGDGGHDVRRRRGGGDADVTRRRPRDGDSDVTRRRPRDGGVDRRRPSNPDVDRPRRRANNKADTSGQPLVYRKPPNLEDAVGKPARKVKRPKRREVAPVSRPRRDNAGNDRSRRDRARRDDVRRANVQTPPRRVTPRAVQKPASRAPVSRPPVSRPKVSQPKSNPRPVSRPRNDRPKVNRKADQTFSKPKDRSRRGNKHRNFYPVVGGYTRTDVYVNARCVKEETLTVHIPQERLDAARFDGFAVLLLDREGQEIPVFVPPNYVEGFRKAVGARGQTGRTYSSDTAPVSPSYVTPSSREPIIYGDPGYPQ